MFSQASVCPRGGGGERCAWQRGGACVAKGGMRGKGGGVRGRRDGHCSGRYASYWNAFFFFILNAST